VGHEVGAGFLDQSNTTTTNNTSTPQHNMASLNVYILASIADRLPDHDGTRLNLSLVSRDAHEVLYFPLLKYNLFEFAQKLARDPKMRMILLNTAAEEYAWFSREEHMQGHLEDYTQLSESWHTLSDRDAISSAVQQNNIGLMELIVSQIGLPVHTPVHPTHPVGV
jgi:hypothetical protein